MSTQLTAITRRRAALVAKSATQRAELVRWAQPWRTPIAIVDHGFALARRVRTHPLAVAVGVLLLFRLGSGRWSLWADRLWTGWQIYQTFQERPAQPRK